MATQLILYTQPDNQWLFPLLWTFGLLLVLLLVVMIVLQRRSGRLLKSELIELEKVRQGNIEYEFVLKAMQLATWHIDPQRRVITVDSDYRDGQGNYTPAQESSLDDLATILNQQDCQRVLSAIDNICAGRTNYYHEQYLVRATTAGAAYWEEGFATVAERDIEGKPTKIVGTSMRIDSQKQLENDLITARNKAEESDRLKTAFLANMGHEIRTPLNAIVGFADLLPVVENDDDRNQLINEIQSNNRKLLRIIDGLVSMSKIESEARRLAMSQTDLNQLLQQILDSHTVLVDQQAVTVASQFPQQQLMMTTDVAKLTEIVNNLMQNAVKFTLQGTITLGYDQPDAHHVRIWVADTGKGIGIDDQQRIFERFVKVDEFVPGVGLGLTVARSHTESLGGQIGVESTLGEGSTFWVTLPLNIQQPY